MSNSLGRLTLDLVAKTAGFSQGMDKAKQATDSWRENVQRNAKIATGVLTGVATAFGAGMLASVKKSLGVADEMAKMAERTGLYVEEIAGLKLAFELGGSSAQELQSVLIKLNEQAFNGNEAFELLGVSVDDAQGNIKDARTLLGDVANAFKQLPPSADKTAVAVKLFGEQGAKLLPILNAGAEGLAEMDAKARDFGLAISTETAQAISAFTTRIDEMWQRVSGFGMQLTTTILPYLHAFLDVLENTAQFVANNFNEIIFISGVALAGFATQAGLVGGALLKLATIFKATTALFLANPFALVATAVAGLIVYFRKTEEALFTLKSVASALFEGLRFGFEELTNLSRTALEWLVNAFGAGFDAISNIAGDALDWITNSTEDSTNNWRSSYKGFFDDTGDGFFGILEKAAKVFDAIGVIVRASVRYIGQLMATMGVMIGKIWENIKNTILAKVEGFINGIISGINTVAEFVGFEALNKISLGAKEMQSIAVEMPKFSELYDEAAAEQQLAGLQKSVQNLRERYEEVKESAEKVTEETERASRSAFRLGGGLEDAQKAARGTAKAMEDAAKAIEDAQRAYFDLAQSLETDDERRLRTLKEQLKIIKAMQEQIDAGIAGAPSQEALDETKRRAYEQALRPLEMPEYQGLSVEIGGVYSEYAKLEEARERIIAWQTEELERLRTFHEEKLISEEEYATRSAEIIERAEAQKRKIQEATYMAHLATGEAVFGQLADMAKQYAGEQSGIYRAMFAMQKSFAIAKSIIAINEGIALAAANPWPQNLAAMASVAAATGGLISAIASVSMPQGMAHDGIDKIPQTGTWLLEKGERVTTAKTSAKLDATLSEIQKNQEQQKSQSQNIRIVNVMDANVVGGYLGSDAGEKLIMNIISNNRNAIKQTIEGN